MRLVALRSIRHTAGTIHADQSFDAEPAHAQALIDAGDAMLLEKYAQAPWTGEGYWRVQPEWAGERVVIIAGGPSVTAEQIDIIAREEPRIIAVNNALTLAPWADLLYFCDARWYDWHREAVDAFTGRRVTLENLALQARLEVRSLRDYGVLGFAPKNDGITNGRNGGYQALHLAAWLGAKRVFLVGFDMRQVNGRMHWHAEHPVATPANIFQGWINCFNSLAPELSKRGVEVVNCTPDSALTIFPHQPLARALSTHLHYATIPRGSPGLRIPRMRLDDTAEQMQPVAAQLDQVIEAALVANESEPASIQEAKPEAAEVASEHDGDFGGAGASGGWSDDSAPAGGSSDV